MPGSTTNATFSEYIYFDGKRAARRDYQSNVFYYFADQVGSARGMFEVLAGSHTASPPCFDADFYPFGGEHDFLNSCPQNYKFMGKERDPETNNDDFGARSYASAYGRFLSADWSSTPTPVPYANLTNPQTLNLYAMVSDNPESFADLDGHTWFPALGGCAGSALGSCNPESDPGTATENAGAAQNQPAAQPNTAQPPAPSSTQPVLVVSSDTTTKAVTPLNGTVAERDIDYKPGTVDDKGTFHPDTSVKQPTITMSEIQTGGTDKQVITCTTSTCSQKGTFEDQIHVSKPGETFESKQTFFVDGKPARIYSQDGKSSGMTASVSATDKQINVSYGP